MKSSDCVAVVGASAAGLSVAGSLRTDGFDGRIVVVDSDDHAFYDRPPLSKSQLMPSAADIALYPQGLDKLELDLRLSTTAESIDLNANTLELSSGEEINFDKLVIATGVEPVALRGGICLRTLRDAMRIHQEFQQSCRVIVIGAGILGCELAALARKLGKKVTMVDMASCPMGDRFGLFVGERARLLHERNDVAMHFSTGVVAIDDVGETKTVSLTNGETVHGDLVLIAIGARPSTDWLADSGLEIDNGVVCNQFCCAADDVYAAGDVARWYNPRFGRHMRVEHRMNATEQGIAVAANLLGREVAFEPIPFFWTDQYDSRIQAHGVVGGDLDIHVLSDSSENDRFALAYHRNGLVEGTLSWNMPRAAREGRQLIGKVLPDGRGWQAI